MKKYDVAIVGGGASGLLCAIECAKNGKSVVVLEASDRVGKKLLASGNGRCNLSNKNLSTKNFNNDFVAEIIEKYPCDYVVKYFESLGLLCKNDDDRIYPQSESSATVLSILLLQLQRYRVEVVCDARVEKIKKMNEKCDEKNVLKADVKNNENEKNVLKADVKNNENEKNVLKNSNESEIIKCVEKDNAIFEIFEKGQSWQATNVVLACGSKASFGIESYDLAVAFGHSKSKIIPSLASLATTAFCGANGVRAKATANLIVDGKIVAKKSGEFLFKDNALSGILAFELSSVLARQRAFNVAKVSIDFVPNLSEVELENFLRENAFAVDPLIGVVNKAIARIVLRGVMMDRSLLMTAQKCKNIAKACKNFEVEVSLNDSFANAQVCSGGLDTKNFDNVTLQSKLCKGLFVCGEMLDVDGDCGGYNLHWAWASALSVANEIVK